MHFFFLLSTPFSCFFHVHWLMLGEAEVRQVEFNTHHKLLCTWILTKLFFYYCSSQTAPPPSINKTTLSNSLSLSLTHTHTHTHTRTHKTLCGILMIFRCVRPHPLSDWCVNVDVCPLRPSGYYTPTDGALPFIAHTFCEFSHFPPQKHLFYVDVKASVQLPTAVSALMRSK